jgi:hypothetical protein
MENIDPALSRNVASVVENLGHELEANLQWDEATQTCQVEYDGSLMIQMQLLEGGRLVIGAIVAEHVAADAKYFGALMEYQWMGIRTGGAALAWNPEAETLVLWESAPAADLTADSLRRRLEHLISNGLRVRDELARYRGERLEIRGRHDDRDESALASTLTI